MASPLELRVATEDLVQVAEALRRDFEGTCVAIASEIAVCDDPTHWLDLLSVLVIRGPDTWDCNERKLSSELVERLEMDLLPQVVQILLGKSFELEPVEAVNRFLQWTLASVKKCLERGDISRLLCLARILDAHRRFYLYHGASNDGSGLNQDQEVSNTENQETLEFTVRKSSEYTSRYFIRNLEYWGQVGGFSVILDVLQAGTSFEALQCILRTLYDVKDHLSPDFLLKYLPALTDAMRTVVRSLEPAEFYAVSRDSLLEVVQVMELLLLTLSKDEKASKTDKRSIADRESCEQRVQLLRLEISLRFFQSNSLEKRIYGLTEIVVIITRLYNDQIQEQVEPTALSLYATLNYLVDWMHETRLIEELLGEKMHVELIKRSTSLFQFVSELEVLPTEWIDLVWNCYCADADLSSSDEEQSRPVQRRHEAFRSTIHDLLLEMATFMERPSLVHLVRRIEAVKARLDSNQLGIVAAIAARRLPLDVSLEQLEDSTPCSSFNGPRPQRSLRQRILMHLWSTVLPIVKSEDFRDEILLRMHEILRLEATNEDGLGEESGASRCATVDELLRLCLDNISRRENLVVSLKLFTQLSSLVDEIGLVLSDTAQRSTTYVRILQDEAAEYKQGVRQSLNTSEWLEMDDDQRANLPMLKEYVSEIKNRLLALRAAWILDECGGDDTDSSFSEEQLNNVWELLIANAFLRDEAALCFQWIELCMNTLLQPRGRALNKENATSSRTLMPIQIAEYVLTTKFSTLPGDRITLSTLCCFHSIFRRLNHLKGGLEIVTIVTDPSRTASPTGNSSDDDKNESVELMTGLPLVGLDELWQLAVRATDSAVAEELITLLASFHLSFAPSIRQTEVPFQWKLRFLEKCMEFIATAKADAELLRTQKLSSATDENYASKLTADVAIVTRCVDLLRYFLEACKLGDDCAVKVEEEKMLQQLERDGILITTEAGDNCTNARHKTWRLEHLEERLPYLEIYPSPLKDAQSESFNGAKAGYRTGRRPSWTFRQQHALLDVIVDTNEDVEVEDIGLIIHPSDADNSSSLKVDLRENLLKIGSPSKPNMRSPGVRATLRWPQAPSPRRGPDLRPEDIDQALTEFTSGGREEDNHQPTHSRDASSKSTTRYGIMSQILANQGSHFDELLELVDWDETTSQRTWDLLCRLPTNNELLRKMIRLRQDREAGEQVDWPDLLNASNVHRLLYALRLVEALLIPVNSTVYGDSELNSGRRQWRERFVRLGGALHLYETLLKWPEEQIIDGAGQYLQNIRATCLAAVMRVLNYFFCWKRLSATEKTPPNNMSLFDLRLQNSTLPAFINSIELPSLLKVAVRLTARFPGLNSDKKMSFSDEAAEAVYYGVQMFCSLIRFAPYLTLMVFEAEPGSDILPRITMTGWLKTLLVDCPSKPTRIQVLGALSDMATAFSVLDSCSSARDIFEPLVVSAYYLVSEDYLCKGFNFSVLEELFTFCQVLLGCRKRVRESKGTEDSDDTNDILAVALIRHEIPGRLVRNVSRIVSQRQAAVTLKTIRAPRNQDEGILGGYLQLLALLAIISEKTRTAILEQNPTSSNDLCATKLGGNGHQMIRFIHTDLLFGETFRDLDRPSTPICTSSLIRNLAQRLLLNLVFPGTPLDEQDAGCGVNGDILVLLDHLRDYQARVLEAVNLGGRQWNYTPADAFLDASKSTYHAGLVNPGCICYMNSLVQQLFMIPTFCRGLLALECSQIVPDRSSLSLREEVEQLQKLFVSLAYTNYRSCDPIAFAHSHKDMEGNATNVHIQMDADEFFSLLLDRLEMFLRPKAITDFTDGSKLDQKDFMASCFGGVLVNQILTQQGNLSEREEKFFALSLEVSKKRHLTESLELYVEGETLEGENAYFCEREQRKVSATKRVCIKKLPQTLVCHLKRFEFDYDLMEKVKINDYLEFPMEIDMFPYTSEALAATVSGKANDRTRRTILYDLVGVVVHSGTSDTGHYYSFIKDRQETERQRWMEFNDEVVREFDEETMGQECFGGEEVAQKWDAGQGTYSPIVQMKRRSAYMLIYERRLVEESGVLPRALEPLKLSSEVQALAIQIMQENTRHEGVVNAFDRTYEQFIFDLTENITQLSPGCSTTVTQQACQLACQFLLGICSLRCHSTLSSPQIPAVSSRYKISARVALWLTDYDKSPSNGDDDERVQLSQWILTQVVAPPTASLSNSRVESQRTWLFDTLFLASGNQELVDSCFQILFATVKVLAYEATVDNVEAEQVLVVFFRESLNLFYSREAHLEVCDPASSCVLTLSMETRVAAIKSLGAFFDKCINELVDGETMTVELDTGTIHRLFLEKLQFLHHFLLTLQTPWELSDVLSSDILISNHVSIRGIAPLAIEARSSSPPLRENDLRLWTFQLETKLLKHLMESYEEPETLPVDMTLLLSHTALKNMVLFGLEGIILPILTRIIYENEASSSHCDRLVSLLIGVLEEIKDTHAHKVLAVVGRLLDKEEEKLSLLEEEKETSISLAWTVHHHVFSPTRGLLESVTYYRDHGSYEYTLLLLEFVAHRASVSPKLQELLKCDPKFHNNVRWIPQWLADHLDSNGAVRQQLRAKDRAPKSGSAEGRQDVLKLFIEVEKAFGLAVPDYCEDIVHDTQRIEEQRLVLSNPISPTAVAAEDVILEALALQEENQYDKHCDNTSTKHSVGEIRQLDKTNTDEIGPEHGNIDSDTLERPRTDWKLHRSREELSMALRIDLDITHNNAREA